MPASAFTNDSGLGGFGQSSTVGSVTPCKRGSGASNLGRAGASTDPFHIIRKLVFLRLGLDGSIPLVDPAVAVAIPPWIGGPMSVQVSLSLTPAEEQQLAEILQCQHSDLESALAPYATAALEEYARMFLGQRVFTRGSDIREYRVFLLIRHAFGNRFPNDQKLCDLFQTRLTEARSLIRAVSAKYQYELHDARDATLKAVLAAAQQQGDNWLISVNSQPIVEQLNRELAAINTLLPPVTLSPNTISTYIIPDPSYKELTKKLA
jgi:hypothetical protein